MRVAQVIALPEENYQKYKELHANCWPEVIATLLRCNVRNYSIYYRNEQLFSYFEYIGSDYETDMAKIAECPKTQEWWDVCKPIMRPYDDIGEGEFWSTMEEVFHMD